MVVTEIPPASMDEPNPNPMNRTKFDFLFRAEEPYIWLGEGEAERADVVPSFFYSREGLDVCVRQLRGGKMQTIDSLMDEFGAALQFFLGFGETWYALEDCLGYLDEWLPAEAYVLVIEQAEDVLKMEEPEQLVALLQVLDAVGQSWSLPIIGNERFSRSAIPFHVLFHLSPGADHDLDRYLAAAREKGVRLRSGSA
jgi:hypothetical protein